MTKVAYVHDNMKIKETLSGFMTYQDLPHWVDDCIRGAVGQINTGARQVSPAVILNMLRSLDVISVASVRDSSFNRKQEVIYGKGYSVRMLEYYTSALRCASQAIEHQLWIGRKLNEGFDFYADRRAYLATQ